jgi:CPA2 family monovalent cation:H+ antiporter-2
VIVRSHDDTDIDRLRAAGAAEVVPEAIEGSLMLASHALVMLGVPLRRVVHRVQAAREERYASLRGYFHGAGDAPDHEEHLHVRLHSVALPEGAAAIGKQLALLKMPELGAEVSMLRRGKSRIDVTPHTVLQQGDIVVLRGSAEAVSRAEERLYRE